MSIVSAPDEPSFTLENLIETISKGSFRLIAAIVVGFLGSAASFAAAPDADAGAALTRVVKYGDLNLDSAAGVAALRGRLHGAAKTVCAPLEGTDLDQKQRWQGCYDRAMASAVADVNNGRVTAAAAAAAGPKHAG